MGAEANPAAVPDEAKWITMVQLCAARQCSEKSIRRGMLNGSIPFQKFGRLVRFPRDLLGDSTGPIANRGGRDVQIRG